MSMEKLYGIFNRNDMVELRLINEIDDCSERRALSASGWTSDEHQPVLYVDDLLQLGWQVKVVEVGWIGGNNTHDDGVSASLLEDIHTKPRLARSAERKVG